MSLKSIVFSVIVSTVVLSGCSLIGDHDSSEKAQSDSASKKSNESERNHEGDTEEDASINNAEEQSQTYNPMDGLDFTALLPPDMIGGMNYDYKENEEKDKALLNKVYEGLMSKHEYLNEISKLKLTEFSLEKQHKVIEITRKQNFGELSDEAYRRQATCILHGVCNEEVEDQEAQIEDDVDEEAPNTSSSKSNPESDEDIEKEAQRRQEQQEQKSDAQRLKQREEAKKAQEKAQEKAKKAQEKAKKEREKQLQEAEQLKRVRDEA